MRTSEEWALILQSAALLTTSSKQFKAQRSCESSATKRNQNKLSSAFESLFLMSVWFSRERVMWRDEFSITSRFLILVLNSGRTCMTQCVAIAAKWDDVVAGRIRAGHLAKADASRGARRTGWRDATRSSVCDKLLLRASVCLFHWNQIGFQRGGMFSCFVLHIRIVFCSSLALALL